ncbi:MAG: inosine/xanthosine triphosphatase [Chloroflexi bacterium]|nr:inosine/xanthosine triphosphatase [Chloroflexota bacterium]
MRIAIGSTNPVKCNAVRAVLKSLYPQAAYLPVEVPSDVASQPWGDVETRRGALNRARAALARTGAEMGIGLEAGVQESEFGLFTCAWCVIVDLGGLVGVGGNSSIQLPPAVAERLYQGVELGQAMDEFAGEENTKHRNGAIGILTNNLATRQSAYESIIRLALAPFQHPDWYQ